MRYVVRNSFARETILSERVSTAQNNGYHGLANSSCAECGGVRWPKRGKPYLLRFHVDPDSGRGGPICGGKAFCSRGCAESYIGRNFDESKN